MAQDKLSQQGVVNVRARHLSQTDSGAETFICQVVKEDALILKVQDIGNYTLMWTPTTDAGSAQGFTPEDGILGDEQLPEGLCLALGFAMSEGLISSLSDIKSLSVCPDDASVVQLQLRDPTLSLVTRKNVVINSSCGICGPREILEDNALQLPIAPDTLRISHLLFPSLMGQMRSGQAIFEQTGGSHAAAIFDDTGKILAIAEDLGRHNAMDKAIGMALVQRGDVAGCGIALSSRLSLELVLKAVRTGLQLVLAVSAPTSMAIAVAEKFGITLCGFVREQRATVYTHPQRVIADNDLQA